MSNFYTLADAPPVPGLRFRPFAGVSDADALYAIHAGRAERDEVDPLSSTERAWTREEFETSLAAMAASGADRTILAEIDGRAVGYNRVFDWVESDGAHVWLNVGWVLPAWRGRGLGTALLRWSERRTRELAEQMPDRWEYAANASSTETEATALLLDNGYRAAYTVLEMGLEALETEFLLRNSVSGADGITISRGRVEDAPRIAASVDESYRHEYPGGRYAEQFDPAAYAEELAGAPHDPALWRVAWDGDEIVGQVIPRVERGRAEIYEVSVRPGWRRRGIARALLSDALLGLRDTGLPVRLHTMREFPTQAHRLYSSLGFRVLKEFPRYRKAG
jgi:GNAT superfamily N-acetyltransferase